MFPRHPLVRLDDETKTLLAYEAKETVKTRLAFFTCLVYLLFAAFFMFVGTKESAVMGFTGMGRLLFTMSHGLVFVLPLLALCSTLYAFSEPKSNGSLEFFLSLPISRSQWFFATVFVRLAILILPYWAILGAMTLVGWALPGQQLSPKSILVFLGAGTALLWCFAHIGLLISQVVASQTKGLITMLATWFGCLLLLDFALMGLLLRWPVPPEIVFLLACLNPIQSARLAILSVLDKELALLGPVGFFIANNLGGLAMASLGILWPSVVGLVVGLAAHKHFLRNDLL